MSKIKCVKLEFPQCNTVGLAQVFLKTDNSVRYIRFRHYIGLNDLRKAQFEYHSIENLENYLQTLKIKGIDLLDQLGQAMVTKNSKNLSPNQNIQVSTSSQEWARSLARIKVSAFGAGDRGFKSHRARQSSLALLQLN